MTALPLRPHGFAFFLALLLAACSKETPPAAPLAAPQACAIAEGQPAAAALQAAKDLQAKIQAGPLYQAAAADSALSACNWRLSAAISRQYAAEAFFTVPTSRRISRRHSRVISCFKSIPIFGIFCSHP